MFQRIVVPLDGSPLAEEALSKAKELSKALNSPLVLVRIVDTLAATRLSGVGTGAGADFTLVSELLTEEQDDAKTYLEQTVHALQQEGYTTSGEVKQGAVASTIVDSAGKDDVIVIASHGRTGVQRWFLGSVAEDVIRHAVSPVLLIRGQKDETS